MIETFVKERGIYYLVIALCAIGVMGKLYESHIYQKLLRAVENPERTDNAYLKQLKLKYKSYHRLEKKIYNIDVFIEASLLRYKHHFMRLENIHTVNARIMLLCIIASCLGVGGSIYFELDRWEMMYYILTGALSVAVLELIDVQCGIDLKRKFLFVSLKDYLENVLANQMGGIKKDLIELDLTGTQAQELEERTKKVGQQVATAKAPEKRGKEKMEKQLKEISDKMDEKIAQNMAQEKVIAEVIKEFFP